MNGQEVDDLRTLLDELGADARDSLVGLRHHLHAHPELSNRESATAALVAERLRAAGVDEVRTGIAGHGVVGVLRGGLPGDRVVALRADMDALPVAEQSGVDFASKAVDADYPGGPFPVAHACRHDCHTATVVTAASVHASVRDRLPGTVLFVFQPADPPPRRRRSPHRGLTTRYGAQVTGAWNPANASPPLGAADRRVPSYGPAHEVGADYWDSKAVPRRMAAKAPRTCASVAGRHVIKSVSARPIPDNSHRVDSESPKTSKYGSRSPGRPACATSMRAPVPDRAASRAASRATASAPTSSSSGTEDARNSPRDTVTASTVDTGSVTCDTRRSSISALTSAVGFGISR